MMHLLSDVAETLCRENIPFALIGAAAMAAHGVSRSTYDTDLFAVSSTCLKPQTWIAIEKSGATVDVRQGDDDDPLLGVVRIALGMQVIDVVVGRYAWQRDVISRASSKAFLSVQLPIVSATDLVLLKLYAGGQQDRWDIEQLLASESAAVDLVELEQHVQSLPGHCQKLWMSIRGRHPH
jgi:hypothetical protein